MPFTKIDETGVHEISERKAIRPFLEYLIDGEEVFLEKWFGFKDGPGVFPFKFYTLLYEPEFSQEDIKKLAYALQFLISNLDDWIAEDILSEDEVSEVLVQALEKDLEALKDKVREMLNK
jgi:hypothetical protein